MNFNQQYNRENFINFLSGFLPDDFAADIKDGNFGRNFERITAITELGKVKSLGTMKPLAVYEIKHKSENDPRVSLTKEAFWIMKDRHIRRALMVFSSNNSKNYRFSLMTIELEERGNRVRQEFSNPRRYSFFLGPDSKIHTPNRFLIEKGKIKEKDFDDLISRFNIEVVNKDFYREISECFYKLAGAKIGNKAYKRILELPSVNKNDYKRYQEFTVRLIGRIIFIWFLKHKKSNINTPLIPHNLISSQSVDNFSNYYHEVLEKLFFEILNKPIKKRKKGILPNSDSIPFLNGGLFDPQEDDFYEDKQSYNLTITDDWFRQFFKVLELYNFTIDESTPADIEISVDPEMLGRIFENLLAEINPSTGESARKATGSYYTPRLIVEYMVNQSLKYYLLSKTGIEENKIEKLLSYSDDNIELSDDEKNEIIKVLDEIKIIDPACGSGAFPMGALQKMLLVLQKVDPQSKKWLSKQLAKIDNEIARKEVEKKLKNENWDYVHKLGIIQNSIYGVDIQPIAVEISKLRFFLSLIVDEKIEDEKENRGIEPLPNLEFKFVAANTLINLPEDKGQGGLFEATEKISKLRDLRNKYLKSYGQDKEKIENEFRLIQKGMVDYQKIMAGAGDKTLKLADWNPFSGNSSVWFDSEWMFGVEGFNVVIGNPPYISSYGRQAKKFKKNEIQYFIKKYNTFSKISKRKNVSINTIMLFLEQGFRLTKHDGILNYIIDQAFLNIDVYCHSREYLIKNFKFNEIVSDLKFPQVVTEACILNMKNKLPNENYEFLYKKKDINVQARHINIFEIIKNDFGFALSKNNKLIEKIEGGTKLLKDCVEIFTGMQIIPEYFLSDDDSVISLPKWHRNVFSKNITRYKINWPTKNQKGKYITYDVDLQREVRKKLQKKIDKGVKCRKPETLSIGSSRKEYRFFSPKIILSQTVSNANNKIQLQAALDNEVGYYGNVSIHLIKNDNVDYLKFLLSILNSTLINYYSIEKKLVLGAESGSKKTPQIRKGAVDKIPIKKISQEQQKPFIKLVDQILKKKKDNLKADTGELEREIDGMVYELYGLGEGEIGVVEENNVNKKIRKIVKL